MTTHWEVGQECIESESMLPDIPSVCKSCGHLISTKKEGIMQLKHDTDPEMVTEIVSQLIPFTTVWADKLEMEWHQVCQGEVSPDFMQFLDATLMASLVYTAHELPNAGSEEYQIAAEQLQKWWIHGEMVHEYLDYLLEPISWELVKSVPLPIEAGAPPRKKDS